MSETWFLADFITTMNYKYSEVSPYFIEVLKY